jgi:hypothetical protein
MELTIPTSDEVRAALAPLTPAQMQRLSELSGVPFHTLRKVRTGETGSPGIETVRSFAPHIKAVIEGVSP